MISKKTFKGLNNVSDPLRLGLPWLVRADNVDITNTGAIKKRSGYRKVLSGAITGAYSTLDFSRCYVVDDGVLKALAGSATVSLISGLSPAQMHFTEVNDQVFFSNGVDSGIILPDNTVAPWRESRLQEPMFLDAAGQERPSLLEPLPFNVSVIQHWKSRIYAAQYFSQENQSVLWFSQPLGYHLFDLDDSYFMLPGRIMMLAPHGDALVIGTDSRIYAYDGQKLEQLAAYGVVPGWHWSLDDERLLFWSTRGLCAAMPFANLTERQISVAPGVSAGGTLVHKDGSKRYLVALQQGGTAFNSHI